MSFRNFNIWEFFFYFSRFFFKLLNFFFKRNIFQTNFFKTLIQLFKYIMYIFITKVRVYLIKFIYCHEAHVCHLFLLFFFRGFIFTFTPSGHHCLLLSPLGFTFVERTIIFNVSRLLALETLQVSFLFLSLLVTMRWRFLFRKVSSRSEPSSSKPFTPNGFAELSCDEV